jgi:hypothetical protein
LVSNILLYLTNKYEYSNIILFSDTGKLMLGGNYTGIIDNDMIFDSS